MNMIKTIIFDLDDTLFDSTDLVSQGRKEACKAMIDAGLKAKSVSAVFGKLNDVVKKLGTNHPGHYDELVRKYNNKKDSKIIAAGVVAYHDVKISKIHLYPKAKELLKWLVKKGYTLILLTKGVPEKQWEKIWRLNITEFFDEIMVVDSKKKQKKKNVMVRLKKKMKLRPKETLAVGNKLKTDIVSANNAGFVSVRVLQGKYKNQRPKTKTERPDYSLQKIADLKGLLYRIVK